MPTPDAAFFASGLLLSALWVVWVALHSWAQQRSEDRMIRPTLITLGAIALGFPLAYLLLPRPWPAVAIFVGPLVGSYYIVKGALDPGRRRLMRIALVATFLTILAGLFALDAAKLLV